MNRGIIAVDPGIRGCGVACFFERRLFQATYVKNPVLKGDSMEAIRSMAEVVFKYAGYGSRGDVIVVEFPKVYVGSKAKGDPHDLLTLAAIDGALALGFNGDVTRYEPRDWKGQVDPDVLIERVKRRVRPEERPSITLPAKSLEHNVWDAVGIGLKFTGRFEKDIVISR